MASEIHVDDIGTRFLITVKDDGSVVDISQAAALQVSFRKPSDLIIERSPSTQGTGSSVSGVMYYDSIAGDLDEVGHYKLQGKVTLGGGSGIYYTDIHTFKVNCNI
jgi:hypothetical protein